MEFVNLIFGIDYFNSKKFMIFLSWTKFCIWKRETLFDFFLNGASETIFLTEAIASLCKHVAASSSNEDSLAAIRFVHL